MWNFLVSNVPTRVMAGFAVVYFGCLGAQTLLADDFLAVGKNCQGEVAKLAEEGLHGQASAQVLASCTQAAQISRAVR